DGANVGRGIGGVSQRSPDLGDSEIQASVEIHGCAVRPQRVTKGFAGNDLATGRKQQGEESARLSLQTDRTPLSEQLTGVRVEIEKTESSVWHAGTSSILPDWGLMLQRQTH